MIEQRREQVAEETKKIKAEIFADQQKQMAQIQAEALKTVSEIEKETAAIRANRVRTISRAEADAITLVEGEKANGLKLNTNAFKNPEASIDEINRLIKTMKSDFPDVTISLVNDQR